MKYIEKNGFIQVRIIIFLQIVPYDKMLLFPKFISVSKIMKHFLT